jgi:hypothetical protein
MTALADWPPGPKVFLDSADVDGVNNALIAHRNDVYTWKNQGSAANDFAQTSAPKRPLMKKATGATPEVAFDGRSDALVLAASAASLAFITATGVFDIAIVMRRRGGANAGSRYIFGAYPKGLAMVLTANVLNTSLEGAASFEMTNGVTDLVTLKSKLQFPIGQVTPIFIRGTGTQFQVTRDFWNWETQTYLASPIAGDASTDYAIGTNAGLVGTEVFFGEFDLHTFAVWDRNLTASELQNIVLPQFVAAEALP